MSLALPESATGTRIVLGIGCPGSRQSSCITDLPVRTLSWEGNRASRVGRQSLACPRVLRFDLAPRSRCQSFYAYFSDGCAFQAERRKPHIRSHAPQLTVLSLTYRELHPRR